MDLPLLIIHAISVVARDNVNHQGMSYSEPDDMPMAYYRKVVTGLCAATHVNGGASGRYHRSQSL